MKPCRTHGETKRYASNGKCVLCVSERGKVRHAAKIERRGNQHTGLKDGFIRLGTVAHRILLYVHEAGPSLHAELVEALGERGVSANLGRLVRHGFLYRAGRQSYKPGVRGGALFSLQKLRAVAQVNTAQASQARYRAAKKQEALRVASVFEWRGAMPLAA